MSTFSTEVNLKDNSLSILRTDRLLTLGSCFSDHIGGFLKEHKFETLINPLGIIYNPVVLSTILDHLSSDDWSPDEAAMVWHGGLWHSLQHHGQFSAPEKASLIVGLQQAYSVARDFLARTKFLIVTLGSAHAYQWLESGSIVANCHKIPMAKFQKILISAEQIDLRLQASLDRLISANRDIQVVLTVSPVRYIRDGLTENNRSKAQLITAIHSLVERNSFCHYFPAYEIVIDELRDYRFYNRDMVHPSDQAVEYVLNKFVNHHFTHDAKEQIRLIGQFNKSLNHRPLHPEGAEYEEFRKNLKTQIQNLQQKYPDLDFQKEFDSVKSR
ncbi:MAG: GSCFA domain-containing protein [Saprospiraceae bacterium]|nr:GSCFA domain-containing protein [Saprospiraceae bacterium]